MVNTNGLAAQEATAPAVRIVDAASVRDVAEHLLRLASGLERLASWIGKSPGDARSVDNALHQAAARGDREAKALLALGVTRSIHLHPDGEGVIFHATNGYLDPPL